ncbi:hypothetical protein C8J57DRAFT_1068803, partial [Mycena rebaudengoi]
TRTVCHHGAGLSACLARELGASVDVLGEDLSIDVLVENLAVDVRAEDFVCVLQAVFADPRRSCSSAITGAAALSCARAPPPRGLFELQHRVSGVAILDIAEGSAIEALAHMLSLRNWRLNGFDSLDAVIQWHVKSKSSRSTTSARVSVPSSFCYPPLLVLPLLCPPTLLPPLLLVLSFLLLLCPRRFTGAFLAARLRLFHLAGTDRLDRSLMIT